LFRGGGEKGMGLFFPAQRREAGQRAGLSRRMREKRGGGGREIQTSKLGEEKERKKKALVALLTQG